MFVYSFISVSIRDDSGKTIFDSSEKLAKLLLGETQWYQALKRQFICKMINNSSYIDHVVKWYDK